MSCNYFFYCKKIPFLLKKRYFPRGLINKIYLFRPYSNFLVVRFFTLVLCLMFIRILFIGMILLYIIYLIFIGISYISTILLYIIYLKFTYFWHPIYLYLRKKWKVISFLLSCIPPYFFFHKYKKSTFADWYYAYWKTCEYEIPKTLSTFSDIYIFKNLDNSGAWNGLHTNVTNMAIMLSCFIISLVLMFKFSLGFYTYLPMECFNHGFAHNILNILGSFVSNYFILESDNSFGSYPEGIKCLDLSESTNTGFDNRYNTFPKARSRLWPSPGGGGGGNNNTMSTVITNQDSRDRNLGIQDIINPLPDQATPIVGSFRARVYKNFQDSVCIVADSRKGYSNEQMEQMLRPFLLREPLSECHIEMAWLKNEPNPIPAICVDKVGEKYKYGTRDGLVIPNIWNNCDRFSKPTPKVLENGKLFFKPS